MQSAPFSFNTVTIGGRNYSPASGLVILQAGFLTANQFAAFRTNDGVGDYQVASGKTLTLIGYRYFVQTGVAVGAINFGYGDTSVGGVSNSAPTNPIYFTGSTNIQTGVFVTAGASLEDVLPNNVVPAQKYPMVRSSSNSIVANITIFGILA